MNQKSINQWISLSGKGLHSGKKVQLQFFPAAENHGIVFQRIDLENKPFIQAKPENVFDTSRGTSLKENNAIVRTVEHLMAALAALSIDNVLIKMDAEETPILDGSAAVYLDVLKKTGICKQNAKKKILKITKELIFEIPEKGVFLKASPSENFEMTVNIDFETQVLGKQQAILKNMKDFEIEMAQARTFVFLNELQYLVSQNLSLGGSLDNAIVFVDKVPEPVIMEQLARFFHKKHISVTANGVLNHNPLRYENEAARHKLLDLVGDLYLLGCPIQGKITAFKPGHFANTEFAKKMKVASTGDSY